MSANSFLETTRSLRLYVPQLPITLAEQFIRDRYRRILERRDWSGLRAEAEFQLNAEKADGSVTFTNGSTTITGVGTTFATTDLGRQIKIGVGSPIYTITTVNIGPQTLVVDRAIGVATSTAVAYRIFDGYVTPPSNFMRFLTVRDPILNWRLRHWITSDELNSIDPQRNYFGNPYALVDRLYSSSGIPQYEAWPFSTTARSLYYTYMKQGSDLINDTDTPIWPLRSDVLVAGALADVARWPGTTQSPNPYFSRPEYWKAYESEFEDKMIDLERRDEDIYITMIQANPDLNWGLAPWGDTNYNFSHVL